MTKPKVLISDKMDPNAAQIFRERGCEVDEITGKTPEELKAIIGQYDGLAIRSATKVTQEILDAATNLKVVGRAGIGVDNVDIPAASAKGVVVMNTPFGNSITTAEHAIALMFALARQLPEADASTQAGKWEKNRFMGVEVTGKTLGLIGAGNIGSIVASRAQGLRMKVVAFDPFLTPERAVEMGVEKADLDTLLAKADFITLHTPLTDQTRNILSRENLARPTKPSAAPTSSDNSTPTLRPPEQHVGTSPDLTATPKPANTTMSANDLADSITTALQAVGNPARAEQEQHYLTSTSAPILAPVLAACGWSPTLQCPKAHSGSCPAKPLASPPKSAAGRFPA